MPYYIYRVTPMGPIRQLVKLSQFDVYKDASLEARRLRREADPGDGAAIRMIFAENELQAEDLLNQPPREAPMTGEDY
ncbi:MAG: hypothetical protein M0Q22_00560 [Sulfuritalea sp.]|jgi:hypothetical protein|nr:hypothetical protein [Sulfuritalea sp.]